MSATYDPTLPTDLDWVRFLTGDRDVIAPRLQDEEITALLAEEKNRYFAAAQAGEMILAKSGGLVEKQVGDLRLRWSDGGSENAYRAYLRLLRERGAELVLKQGGRSVVFRMV